MYMHNKGKSLRVPCCVCTCTAYMADAYNVPRVSHVWRLRVMHLEKTGEETSLIECINGVLSFFHYAVVTSG